MRTIGAAFLATTLVVTSAFAAPLAPGKPAGVKKAQGETGTMMIVAGVAVVGIGIGLVASGNGNGPGVSSTATSATGTNAIGSP